METVVRVSSEEVRDAAIAAGLRRIPHHRCGGCGVMVAYEISDGQLAFDPSCDCSSFHSDPSPRDWSDASDWINMQRSRTVQNEIALRFGLNIEDRQP